MLAGGKEVNYLMINGDVFESNKVWPRLYKFGASNVKGGYWYYLIKNSKGKLVPTPYLDSSFFTTQITIEPNNTLVYKTMMYEGQEYALVDCTLSGTYDGFETKMTNTNNIRCAVWIRMFDFGGGTPIAQNGGVNSPSYLLFIYDIWEVAPYVS